MDMPLSNFSISADTPMLPHSAKSPSRILLLWFTADHGGHDRTHGTDSPEDMTIPFIIKGKNFKVGEKISRPEKRFQGRGKDFKTGEKPENVSIKDIAPTVAKLLGIAPDQAWEGKSLV